MEKYVRTHPWTSNLVSAKEEYFHQETLKAGSSRRGAVVNESD